MKIYTTILLLFIYFSCSAQQLSVNIPVTQDHRSDAGVQIEAIDDGYLIVAPCKCHVDALFSDCLGLLKIDGSGSTIWSHIYDGSPDMNLYSPVGDAMVLLGDTIVVCGKIDKVDHSEIRLMSFDMEGVLLNQEDIAIPNANQLLIQGMLVVGDSLVVYGEVNNGERKVYLYFLDHQFNVLGHKLIGTPNLSKGHISLRKKKSEGFILAYSEPHPNSTSLSSAVIADLNDSFEVVFTKKILEGGNSFSGIEIFETEDKGYMLGWYKDLWDTIVFPPLYPYPSAIYKLDSMANVEWEYVFVHTTAKEFISCIETNDGNIFGIGASDYFSANDIYDRTFDGFCFLIDTEGNLLWQRVIADIRDSRSGRFWHAAHNDDDGYAIIGDLDMENPTGVPFLNNPDVWFLTLDENGCWNGNCDKYIAINGDTTTDTDDPLMMENSTLEVYPNPSNGVITIEFSDFQMKPNRMIEVTDLNGRLITQYKPMAPKTILNLSHLNNGIYFITKKVAGRKGKTEKIIIQH